MNFEVGVKTPSNWNFSRYSYFYPLFCIIIEHLEKAECTKLFPKLQDKGENYYYLIANSHWTCCCKQFSIVQIFTWKIAFFPDIFAYLTILFTASLLLHSSCWRCWEKLFSILCTPLYLLDFSKGSNDVSLATEQWLQKLNTYNLKMKKKKP